MSRLESGSERYGRNLRRPERTFSLPYFMDLLGCQKFFVTKEYDVFISHAVEDKIDITNDLNEMLVKRGLKTWYSGNELGLGDSVYESIMAGLDKSNFGIIVLSHNFFRKDWPKHELAVLRNNKTKLFPVWHNITLKEIAEFDKELADLWALSTNEGLDKLANELAKRIRKNISLKKAAIKRKGRWCVARLVITVILIGTFAWAYRCQLFHSHPGNPCPPESTPADRIGAVCADCWESKATGSGACASHGGVKEWRCD